MAPSTAAASEVQSVGPAAVGRFVLHRLAALGPSATELARSVAVLGDESDPSLAARVSGLSEQAARDAVDDLVRADIFAQGERLGFVHPIVRAALYGDLAPGERQARHAAAAEALATAGCGPRAGHRAPAANRRRQAIEIGCRRFVAPRSPPRIAAPREPRRHG